MYRNPRVGSPDIYNALTQLTARYFPVITDDKLKSLIQPHINNECASMSVYLSYYNFSESEFYVEPSYYASADKFLDQEIETEISPSFSINEFYFETLDGSGHHLSQDEIMNVGNLPEMLSYLKIDDICKTEEDKVAAKLRGDNGIRILCNHDDENLLIDESEFYYNNEKIMSRENWDLAFEKGIFDDSHGVWNETQTYIENSIVLILQHMYDNLSDIYTSLHNYLAHINDIHSSDDLLNNLEEYLKPVILKQGYLTSLYNYCNDDNTRIEDLTTYEIIIGERDGECYDDNSVLAVSDHYAIVHHNRDFMVMYINRDEAECDNVYDDYNTALESMEELQELAV